MITITIKTDNAAFEGDDKPYEVARILRDLAETIERNARCSEYVVRDFNGNKVGEVSEREDR